MGRGGTQLIPGMMMAAGGWRGPDMAVCRLSLPWDWLAGMWSWSWSRGKQISGNPRSSIYARLCEFEFWVFQWPELCPGVLVGSEGLVAGCLLAVMSVSSPNWLPDMRCPSAGACGPVSKGGMVLRLICERGHSTVVTSSQGKDLKHGATSVCVPRMSSSHLLPLWETLQDQLVGPFSDYFFFPGLQSV